MTISEMQDALEALGNNLMIISETANAIEASLSEQILTVDQVRWAIVGIIRSIDKAAQDTEGLVNGTIGMLEVLSKL